MKAVTFFAIALATICGAAAADTVPASAPAGKPPRMGVDEIRACMQRNLVDRGSLRDLGMDTTDREGKTQRLKMRLFWKPTGGGKARLNLRLLEPADLKGSSYLLVERDGKEEVYFWLPAAGKVRQITGSEMSRPLWGTDFSYAEIQQVQGLLAEGSTQRRDDARVGDRSVYVLETATSTSETGYQKVVAYVDQTSCVLVKSEFFAKGDKPRKVLEADLATLDKIDTYWFVLAYTMRDLRENTKTVLNLSDLYLLERHSEKLFEPEHFYQSDE